MKKSKKNYIIIVLVVILLASAVGYAAFGGTLKISGTATANGTWNVHFANAQISGTGNTVTPDTENKTLTVKATLGYPGAGATISTDILNEGTVGAKLTGFAVTGDGFAKDTTLSTSDKDVYKKGAILVSVPVMNADATNGEVIAANGTCHFAFDVEWDSNENTVADGGETAEFEITFNYTQSTDAFTSGVSHT